MKKRVFFITVIVLISLASVAVYQFIQFDDGKLHIIFCDIGQGDSILIKTPGKKLILADGGPDRLTLDCLSRHLPFWERELDLMLLSHPHADHFVGFLYVLNRFTVLSFATENLSNKTGGFTELLRAIKEEHITVKHVVAGDQWKIADGVTISIVGPTAEFLKRKDPDGIITDSAESASLATLISYGEFSLLVTGDAPVDELHEVGESIDAVDVLQIPHHGSTTGLDARVLRDLSPQLAVISVGENNYGHPTKKVLDMLTQVSIPVKRTDQEGDVEIVSDGEKWWVVYE